MWRAYRRPGTVTAVEEGRGVVNQPGNEPEHQPEPQRPAVRAHRNAGIIKRAVEEAPRSTPQLRSRAVALEKRLNEVASTLRGNPNAGERTLPEPPTVVERVQRVTFSMLGSSSLPTQTVQDVYKDAASEFAAALAKLRTIAKVEMPALEKALDAAGVPHTPGRFPEWREE